MIPIFIGFLFGLIFGVLGIWAGYSYFFPQDPTIEEKFKSINRELQNLIDATNLKKKKKDA